MRQVFVDYTEADASGVLITMTRPEPAGALTKGERLRTYDSTGCECPGELIDIRSDGAIKIALEVDNFRVISGS